MDYFDRQIVNEINSLIDEHIETGKLDHDRATIIMLHFIRATVTGGGYELHQSDIPLKGLFK